jgi:hypothetical protein
LRPSHLRSGFSHHPQSRWDCGLHALPTPQAEFGLNDIVYKLQEYWCPYFLVFPAAVLFGLIYHRLSRTAAMALLLVLVIFPWFEHPERDINYNEHALVDQWAVNWQTAKNGWWMYSPDHRWLQSPAEFALINKLRDEIHAGRITATTHVIHVVPESVIWKDELLYSLYLGIDDDLYLSNPDHNLNVGPTADSRMHPIIMLPEALAAHPPYIVVYHQAPVWMKLPPADYEEIFQQGDLHLFRRKDLGAKSQTTIEMTLTCNQRAFLGHTWLQKQPAARIPTAKGTSVRPAGRVVAVALGWLPRRLVRLFRKKC